ncbi:MAG TPA: N-acetylmuramoyl-L-alanine amidase, partial [Elusimicrobiota bacterium]|nr:N-acetylmuramoyl-L-alanine amidase [Elusimicrobiota bacterium]
ISLHCNAGLTRASNGFEIYYLSEKATDDEAAAVARRENAVVDLEGVAGPAKEKVEELLWSLARNEHMNDSSEIAALIAHQAAKRLPLANRGVKQAGFYVLRGTAMPAILIETGFITHPKEEGLLRSTRYHQKLIETVYAGLLDYEKRKIQTRLAQSSAGGN